MLYFFLVIIDSLWLDIFSVERNLNLVRHQSNSSIYVKVESKGMLILILKAKSSVHCDDKLLPQNTCYATGATISAADSRYFYLFLFFFRTR